MHASYLIKFQDIFTTHSHDLYIIQIIENYISLKYCSVLLIVLKELYCINVFVLIDASLLSHINC
jgi:hypothetical protein